MIHENLLNLGRFRATLWAYAGLVASSLAACAPPDAADDDAMIADVAEDVGDDLVYETPDIPPRRDVSRAEASPSDGADADGSPTPVAAGGRRIPRCTPGAFAACACADGSSRMQTCGPDGAWEPCVCAGAADAAAPPADAGTRFVQIAVGDPDRVNPTGRSCGLRADGAVLCWGYWGGEVFSSEPRVAHLTPARVPGLEGIRSFGCDALTAIRRDGAALTWDCRGCADTNDLSRSALPRIVHEVGAVTGIATMEWGACFTRAGLPPLCEDVVPMPGSSNPRETQRFTPLTTFSDVAELVGGDDTLCARLESGQVWCWGRGGPNLGDGATTHATCTTPSPPYGLSRMPFDCSMTPVRVADLADAVELVGGDGATFSRGLFFCALRATGVVMCWGDNTAGQLGDGTQTPRATPVMVSGLRDATQIAAGGKTVCARLRDQRVMCWGADFLSNSDGGDGGAACWVDGARTASCSPVAAEVRGIADALQVSVAYDHACALTSGGRVLCWGSNRYGQLGDGSTEDRETPVATRWD